MRKRTVLSLVGGLAIPCGGLAIDAAIARAEEGLAFDVSSGPSSAIITQRSGSFDCLATSGIYCGSTITGNLYSPKPK